MLVNLAVESGAAGSWLRLAYQVSYHTKDFEIRDLNLKARDQRTSRFERVS
jgi:hypothetical protein